MQELIEVPCQSCGKEKVMVIPNHPYFGILCPKCFKGGNVFTKEE